MGSLSKINGKDLYYSFLAGTHKVLEQQKNINKINVFPVPDGDTGTNLATTFRYITENVIPEVSITSTARSIANAALEGSKGNSGIIVAEFLVGFSKKLKNTDYIDVKKFAMNLNSAVHHAYSAVENPVEGTVLTVLREWSEFINSVKERFTSFIHLLPESLKIAHTSLRRTQNTLEILRRNRVVDAGAQGIVCFLEGVAEFIRDRNLKRLLSLKSPTVEEHIEVLDLDQFNYRFCTETILEGSGLEKERIRQAILGLGDSLVIAGSNKKMRIHIHTNSPANFFHSLKDLGVLKYQKADNMAWQSRAAYHRKWNIALVTDSDCDLPEEIMEKYQIYFLPISIFFGDNHYLDKITITPNNFYEMLNESELYPTTSQPNVKDFVNLYTFLCSHYDSIISIHLSKELSGTWKSSHTAADQVSRECGKEISVINSRQLSGSLGLVVYRAALAVEAGYSHQRLLTEMNGWIKQSEILVSVKNFDSMVRGGRVSPMKGRIANWLNLKPIISLDGNGKSVLLEKAFSQKGNVQKVLRRINKAVSKKKVWKYSVLHAHDPAAAKLYAKQLEDQLGKPADFVIDISPVVGLSAGLGALAVSLMYEAGSRND
jgi:DegV family protein with EDD domain